MRDFTYKEYTEEETKIYHAALDKIMEGLAQGLSFPESCDVLIVEDGQLRAFIIDDALKIMIADIHYKRGLPLQHAADTLQVPIDTISRANAEMLEDVEISASNFYRMSSPGGPTGTA